MSTTPPTDSRSLAHVLVVDQVQADVAAIAMEEVLPSSVAEAEALAPEELYKKKRGREAEFLEGAGGEVWVSGRIGVGERGNMCVA